MNSKFQFNTILVVFAVQCCAVQLVKRRTSDSKLLVPGSILELGTHRCVLNKGTSRLSEIGNTHIHLRK